MVAAPIHAPAPQPETHNWLQTLAYHLLPGLAPLALALVSAPVLEAWGVAPAIGYLLALTLGVVVSQLCILYYLGWKHNGRLSLAGIVLLRERISAAQILLYAIGTFLWAGLAFTMVGARLNDLLRPLFDWMPSIFFALEIDWAALPTGVALATLAVGIIGTAFLGPFVEELYFRGFLLPRIPASGTWSPLVNAILFPVYHFWSPWLIPTRVLAILPMIYAVHRKRSIWIGIVMHCLLNLVDLISLLAIVLA